MAAWLSQGGLHRIQVCARRPMRDIVVETLDGAIRATPEVVTDPAKAEPAEWVLVATKTYDAEATARWLAVLDTGHTRVAILQNGVEHVARFERWVDRERLLPVVVECPAERSEPGRVRQRGPAWLVVPEGAAGHDFAALFERTPIAVRTTPDFTTAAWRKLCLNAPGALNAIALRPVGMVHDESVAEVMRGIVREVIAVGRAEGAGLEDAIAEEIIALCRRAPREAVNSIQADRAAGRRMEIDARNGVIARLGRRHGIPTPYNDMAVALLRAVEAPA